MYEKLIHVFLNKRDPQLHTDTVLTLNSIVFFENNDNPNVEIEDYIEQNGNHINRKQNYKNFVNKFINNYTKKPNIRGKYFCYIDKDKAYKINRKSKDTPKIDNAAEIFKDNIGNKEKLKKMIKRMHSYLKETYKDEYDNTSKMFFNMIKDLIKNTEEKDSCDYFIYNDGDEIYRCEKKDIINDFTDIIEFEGIFLSCWIYVVANYLGIKKHEIYEKFNDIQWTKIKNIEEKSYCLLFDSLERGELKNAPIPQFWPFKILGEYLGKQLSENSFNSKIKIMDYKYNLINYTSIWPEYKGLKVKGSPNNKPSPNNEYENTEKKLIITLNEIMSPFSIDDDTRYNYPYRIFDYIYAISYFRSGFISEGGFRAQKLFWKLPENKGWLKGHFDMLEKTLEENTLEEKTLDNEDYKANNGKFNDISNKMYTKERLKMINAWDKKRTEYYNYDNYLHLNFYNSEKELEQIKKNMKKIQNDQSAIEQELIEYCQQNKRKITAYGLKKFFKMNDNKEEPSKETRLVDDYFEKYATIFEELNCVFWFLDDLEVLIMK